MHFNSFDSAFGKSRKKPTESERKCSSKNTIVSLSLYNKRTLRADNSHRKEICEFDSLILFYIYNLCLRFVQLAMKVFFIIRDIPFIQVSCFVYPLNMIRMPLSVMFIKILQPFENLVRRARRGDAFMLLLFRRI